MISFSARMRTVRAELPLDLDRAGAWRRLRDLSSPHLYVPGLTAVAFNGPQREGVGASRGRVWLVNRMRYEVGFGVLGALLDRLLLQRIMARRLRDVTLAQKIHYETGERVTPAVLATWKARPPAGG